MRYHYEIGRAFKGKYGSKSNDDNKEFISKQYNRKEIYVRSTDSEAALDAAQVSMFGK